MKTFKIVGEDLSDGYHTFDELYEHRCRLFVALCNVQPEKCVWKYDNETPDWFILYCEMPRGQVSYHIPHSLLDFINPKILLKQEYRWDGHTSQDVLKRLL